MSLPPPTDDPPVIVGPLPPPPGAQPSPAPAPPPAEPTFFPFSDSAPSVTISVAPQPAPSESARWGGKGGKEAAEGPSRLVSLKGVSDDLEASPVHKGSKVRVRGVSGVLLRARALVGGGEPPRRKPRF